MTYPKILPCKCGADDLEVTTYDNGWKHVGCDVCWYLGPGEGRIVDAIRSHNKRMKEPTDDHAG